MKQPAYIENGERLDSGVANRPSIDIQGNVDYIFGLLRASGLASSQIVPQAPLNSACLPGQPVYLDSLTRTFKPALASAIAAGGSVELAESAQFWGVVLNKSSATVGDLLVGGFAPLNLANAITGPVQPGVYYLSGVTPGKLVTQKQPVSIPVLRADGQGNVLVIPNSVDLLDRHVHYRFPLVCAPAGSYTPPSPGGIHAITLGDATRPGWLPANHASFSGKAPAGAVFGYNLAEHPDLKAIWPPLPISEASLEWNKGQDTVGTTGVPLGLDGLCIIDANGIWWMSNCYGDVPWPIRYGTPGFSLSLSDPVGAECPRTVQMALTLCFSKISYATDATVVTSLVSKNSKLTFRCPNGAAGSAGPLIADLDLSETFIENTEGGLALKDVENGVFKRGPICEGIYSVSPNVILNSSTKRRKISGDVNSPWVYQGLVELAVAESTSLELPVGSYRLDGAEQDYYEDVFYFGFPAGEDSLVRGQINVPTTTGFTSPQLALNLRLLARGAGTLPNLTVTARRLPVTAAGVPRALPLSASEFSVVITTSQAIDAANKYIDITATPFAVANGDIVMFTVKRTAGDGYASAVGLLRATGTLTSA